MRLCGWPERFCSCTAVLWGLSEPCNSKHASRSLSRGPRESMTCQDTSQTGWSERFRSSKDSIHGLYHALKHWEPQNDAISCLQTFEHVQELVLDWFDIEASVEMRHSLHDLSSRAVHALSLRPSRPGQGRPTSRGRLLAAKPDPPSCQDLPLCWWS